MHEQSFLVELTNLFDRELDRISGILDLYPEEKDIWYSNLHVKNSTGNLVLHLVGNLNFFIGMHMGGIKYVRDREAEFSLKNISREQLQGDLENTKAKIHEVILTIEDRQLNDKFPINVLDKEWTNREFLLHLLWHVAYHAGQADYHRKMMSDKNETK